MEKNEKIEITEEQISAIKTYISSRLGIHDINDYDFKKMENDNNKYIVLIQEIQMKNSGIFKHIIKNCSLYVKIYPQMKRENGTNFGTVHLKLQYVHHDGGSNGHDLNFRLFFNGKKVYEQDN